MIYQHLHSPEGRVGDVALYYLNLADISEIETLQPYVSADEWSNATRRPASDSVIAHLAGRALLRAIAARKSEVPPTALQVTTQCPICGGSNGKPRVIGVDLDVSIAHSWPFLLVAASSSLVGCDVEPTSRAMQAMHALPAVSPAGELHIRRGSRWSPQDALRCWTAREAVLKAYGHGFARGLDSLELDVVRDGTVSIRRLPDEATPDTWSLVSVTLAGAIGHVAVACDRPRFAVYRVCPNRLSVTNLRRQTIGSAQKSIRLAGWAGRRRIDRRYA